MRALAVCLALICSFALVGCEAAPPPPAQPNWATDSVARFVDPFIGTGGAGNTFPGAVVPWGMAAPSPHTRLPVVGDFTSSGGLAAAGYVDGDPELHGFGLTHLSGVGCPELGAPVIAVESGKVKTDFDSYGAHYQNERAWPGYYSAELIEPQISAELTATSRGAALRFYDQKGTLDVLIDVARNLSWAGGDGHVE